MVHIRDLFKEIDAKWTAIGGEPIPLQVIGSAALMLQHNYHRVTKDGDVLETTSVTPEVRKQLESLAGKGSEIHKRYKIYIDIVLKSLPLLPQQPLFHSVKEPNLNNFSLFALDAVDVVVSKIKRFNQSDVNDIRAMVKLRVIDHTKLVERFKAAVDAFAEDARAEDLPKCVQRLNMVERDMLDVPASEIDLPDWI